MAANYIKGQKPRKNTKETKKVHLCETLNGRKRLSIGVGDMNEKDLGAFLRLLAMGTNPEQLTIKK